MGVGAFFLIVLNKYTIKEQSIDCTAETVRDCIHPLIFEGVSVIEVEYLFASFRIVTSSLEPLKISKKAFATSRAIGQLLPAAFTVFIFVLCISMI
ncbi:unnamed protein product [Anisakis simplex]|uniref:ABC transporter permease n=1 Tax=Anisakis simplex TaxID=6269 RepID=A0A0M3K8L9_ANISI|nr:unnamed protein product [Anisakis simplex]